MHGNENCAARSIVYDEHGVASSIGNDEKVQTEVQHQSTVVELYARQLQHAGE